MNINNACLLEDRGILFINGKDSKNFLQNLITNDINKVNELNSCFASLLTPQGKYLYDFLIIKHKNGYILDCEKSQIDDLFKQLSLYKLRSDIQILNLSNEFVVVAINYQKFRSIKDTKDTPGFTIKYREDPIFLDPRNKELGGRLIINLEKLYLTLKKLNLSSINDKEYYKLSFDLGILQQKTEKLKNKLFGVECNFEELNAIDFQKGCFIGQENTARIRLKNKLAKRILPLKIIKGQIQEGDLILSDKEEIGKVMINKEYPFALIKFKAQKFSFNTIYNINTATVMIIKPNWINLS
ncbi:folate-binding protein [Candidatus Pelagibacter sp.]|nr:folate-binding protein [Candidatus Pelagibacter sp.]